MRQRILLAAIFALTVACSILLGLYWRSPTQTLPPVAYVDEAGISHHKYGALNSSVYGYRTIQQDGASVAQRDTINFVGGTTVTDDPTNGVTVVTPGTGSGGSPWVTALDCDLTAQSGQVFAANTTYTVCGLTVQKQNSLSTYGNNEVDAAAIINGVGLRFNPNNGAVWPTAIGCVGLGCTSLPRLWIPLTTLVPLLDWHTSIRVWIEIAAESGFAASNFLGASIGVDDTNVQPDATTSTSGCILMRGYDGTAWTGASISSWCTFHSENFTANRNGLPNLDASAANQTEMLEIDSLGAQQTFGLASAASGTWPNNSAMNLVTFFIQPGGNTTTASGTPVPGPITNYGVWVGASTYGAAPGYTVTFSHLRVDYRL